MSLRLTRRRVGAGAGAISVAALSLGLAVSTGVVSLDRDARYPLKAREMAESFKGEVEQGSPGEAGGESLEARTAAEQFAEARTAPGVVNPAGYQQAVTDLGAMQVTPAQWSEVTGVPYDADDTRFRDYYSNSSGGSGKVSGRITGLVADDSGTVYAGGADGGIFRARLTSPGKPTGRVWTPISDRLGSLSTGDVRLAPRSAGASLWLATGEANTGATSYVGFGVYALANPSTSSFAPTDKVGKEELDGTTINALRFSTDGSTVYAATSRGVWSHPTDLARRSTSWRLLYAPNPQMIKRTTSGGVTVIDEGTQANEPNAPYANIVNDVAVDPRDARHVVAAIGWRSGTLSFSTGPLYYNGFYETTDGGATWAKVNPTGAIPADDIGNTTLQFAADGSVLYSIVQSPRLLNKGSGTSNTVLQGVFSSKGGNPAGPWSQIATSTKLANSGSALKQSTSGKGYGPGIQAWYNQSLVVDPKDPQHLFVGLEEVYESHDGGANWTTIGPYWNFYFPCWGTDFSQSFAGCNQTTHPDQHSAAIGLSGSTPMVYIGNDGGVFRRPVNSTATDAAGHATDWQSLNDGSLDSLQYYSVGVGDAVATSVAAAQQHVRTPLPVGNPIVSGGLQDNGGSILFEGSGQMSSNFGGDGGDVIVDPADGCNIVQEYVFLSMRVTNTCAANDDPKAFQDTSVATTRDIAPPDTNARFIAPMNAVQGDTSTWLAGGAHVWKQTQGFAIKDSTAWTPLADLTKLSPSAVTTALSAAGGTYAAGWCGPCNNNGFKRGLVIGSLADGTQQSVDLSGLPNRFVGGVAVDPANDGRVLVAMNGFSRRFTEGPGAGTGHVFELTRGADGRWTVRDVTANLPDLPANAVQVLPTGALLLATDLATFYRAPGTATWTRLGANLPLTTVTDLEVHGRVLYASTHGRGIWKVTLPADA